MLEVSGAIGAPPKEAGDVMVTGGLIFLIVVVGGFAFLARTLRAEVTEVADKARRLHDPATHTLAYALPNGVDPSAVTAPLAVAGFEAIVDDAGTTEHLVIACDEGQREVLRRVVGDLHLSNYDGSAFEGGRVVFEDERDGAQPWRATA